MIFSSWVGMSVLFGILGYIVGKRHNLEMEGAVYGILVGPITFLILIFLKPAAGETVTNNVAPSDDSKSILKTLNSIREEIKDVYKCLRLIKYQEVYEVYAADEASKLGEYTLLEIYELYKGGTISEDARIYINSELQPLYLCKFWTLIYN